MQLIKLSSEKYSQWDEFVDLSPQGTIFSYTWYLDAL